MIDIEERLTFDERSAVNFSLALRKQWAGTSYPALISEYNRSGMPKDSVHEIEDLLTGLSNYPWFSHLERVQQKMLWKVAGDAVTRNSESLLEEIQSAPRNTRGSLTLNPDLQLPKWYTDYDIHIQPGSFYSDDLSAYVYELGARVVMLRDNDGYKFHQLFAQTALPNIPDATQVVDIGCGFGKSTRPLVSKYPTAKVVGVDLAAPGLRLAHAQAEAEGLSIHYKHASGEATGLDSQTCDLVTGTMVLHEMPEEALRGVIAEASRILKPGGELRFLEFQPTGDPLRDATVYGHAERNNEPFFRDLFAADVEAICQDAGFKNISWTPFDERQYGLSPEGWGDRQEWHFPWSVLSATKSEKSN